MPRLKTLPDWYRNALLLESVDAEVIKYSDLLFNSIQKFLEYTDAIPIEWSIPESNNFSVIRKSVSQNESTVLVLQYVHSYLSLKETYNVEFPTIPARY